MVWAGGLALALGGLFLVRVALDAGLFGPLARTIAAAIFGGALIFTGRRAETLDLIGDQKAGALRFLPHLLAGAGIVSLYGAGLAAGALYGFVPPLVALILFVAISLAGLVLALRYGPALGAIALAGAYAGPLFTGASGGSVLYLLPYAAIITALGLALIRMRGWRFVVWVTLIGAAFWGLVGLAEASWTMDWAVPAYGLAITLIGLLFGEAAARQPILLPGKVSSLVWLIRQRGESLFAAYLFAALGGVLTLFAALDAPTVEAGIGGVILHGGLMMAAAWRREGYGLMAPASALLTAFGLMLWPEEPSTLSLGFVAAGIGYGVVGWLAMRRLTVRTPLALASALAPPILLGLAAWRLDLHPSFTMGLMSLAMAVLYGAILDAMRKADPDFKAHPGAAAVYALGLSFSALLAPFLALEGLWLGPTLAVMTTAIFAVHSRFDLTALRGAGVVVGAVSAFLMARPGLITDFSVVGPPVLNTLTLAVLISAGALFAARQMAAPHQRTQRALEGAILVTLFAGIGLVIRHGAGAGSALDGTITLAEAGAHAIAYLAMAAGFAWRLSSSGWLWKLAQGLACVVGLTAILIALVRIEYDPALGWPVFNLLLPAFALPAVLLAVQSYATRKRDWPLIATGLGWLAMLTGWIWVSLEARRAFVGADLSSSSFASGELWGLSIAWIGYALALLAWGTWRERPSARYASLALLLISVVKVFLYDLGALEGLARALSFMGLGGALIGVALFYQRFVFKGSPRAQSPV